MSSTTPAKRISIEAEIVDRREKILDLLPENTVEAKRFMSLAIAQAKDPDLAKCAPVTILKAVAGIAKLGLEVERALGHAYFIPRWSGKTQQNECNLQIGYRGYLALGRRSGRIRNIAAQVIYANDTYDIKLGTKRELEHSPWMMNGESEPGEIVAAYCTWEEDGVKGSVFHIIGMDRIKRAEQAGGKVWKSDRAAMVRKTAVIDAAKLWPLSTEFAHAVQWDEEAERGAPQSLPDIDPEGRLKVTQPAPPQLEGYVEPEDPQEAEEPDVVDVGARDSSEDRPGPEEDRSRQDDEDTVVTMQDLDDVMGSG